MSPPAPKRSLIIPAYAEQAVIGNTLASVAKYLTDNNLMDDTEVIVVTADNPDNTAQIVLESAKDFKNFRFIQPGVRVGKGRDVKAGMAAAQGQYIVFTDADLATPIDYLEQMLNLLRQNGGMVYGVRALKQIHKTWSRRISSRMSNLIIRALIGWNIEDSQCGFKGFDQPTAKIILARSQINGWGFDFEFINIARLHKIRLSALNIPLWRDPKPEGKGLSGDSQFLAMKQAFSELLRVKYNQLKGLYK